jgi:ribonuclease-3
VSSIPSELVEGLGRLEAALGYRFSERELLLRALTHRTYVHENAALGREDNERLEFLGDAVLDLAIGQLLMERLPEASEGELSKARAGLVNEQVLATVADALGLGEHLLLGRGEASSGGRRKPSLLANGCEALVGAVFLDGGFPEARSLVARLFGTYLESSWELRPLVDSKTAFQERTQRDQRLTPRYVVVSETGPDHNKTFEVAVIVGERELARGWGRSKKEAEQRAAAAALTAYDPGAERLP